MHCIIKCFMIMPSARTHRFLTSKPMKALYTTTLLLLLVGLGKLVVVNTDIFNPLQTALGQFHFSDIYFHWHRDHSADVESDIVLVDIQYLHDREEIATLIDSINAYHPRVVALDVIFPPAVSLDPVADSHLAAAVMACSRVVLAQNAVPKVDGTWSMERSFFVEGELFASSRNRLQGVVNLPVSVVRTAESTFTFGDTVLPTLSAQVALLCGHNSKGGTLIDFGGRNILVWTVGAEDFYMSGLEDKIVFVGDMGDLRDFHNIPVGNGGQSRVSGTEIQALSAAALLSPNPYRNLSKGLAIVLQVVLLYLFCWLLHWLPQTMDNWICGALQILFMVLLLPLCYILFVSAHLIISPTLAIIGFGLAGLAKNITDAIIKD